MLLCFAQLAGCVRGRGRVVRADYFFEVDRIILSVVGVCAVKRELLHSKWPARYDLIELLLQAEVAVHYLCPQHRL